MFIIIYKALICVKIGAPCPIYLKISYKITDICPAYIATLLHAVQ